MVELNRKEKELYLKDEELTELRKETRLHE